jgi:hypothetical protein
MELFVLACLKDETFAQVELGLAADHPISYRQLKPLSRMALAQTDQSLALEGPAPVQPE